MSMISAVKSLGSNLVKQNRVPSGVFCCAPQKLWFGSSSSSAPASSGSAGSGSSGSGSSNTDISVNRGHRRNVGPRRGDFPFNFFSDHGRPENLLNSFMNDFRHLDRFFPRTNDFFRSSPEWKSFTQLPPVDLSETDTHIVVHADLPGLTKDEITLYVEDGALLIEAERKSQKVEENKDQNYHFTERHSGKIRRSIDLPDSADGDSIQAAFKDGVLEVKIGKKQQQKPKKIQIE